MNSIAVVGGFGGSVSSAYSAGRAVGTRMFSPSGSHKGQTRVGIGAVFGAMFLILVGAHFVDPIVTAVNSAQQNLSSSNSALVGLLVLVFIVGLIGAAAAHFGLV